MFISFTLILCYSLQPIDNPYELDDHEADKSGEATVIQSESSALSGSACNVTVAPFAESGSGLDVSREDQVNAEGEWANICCWLTF